MSQAGCWGAYFNSCRAHQDVTHLCGPHHKPLPALCRKVGLAQQAGSARRVLAAASATHSRVATTAGGWGRHDERESLCARAASSVSTATASMAAAIQGRSHIWAGASAAPWRAC